jgi:hypothetical protein
MFFQVSVSVHPRDHSEYVRRWVWIMSDWRLTVNPAEKSSLREMLGTCEAG